MSEIKRYKLSLDLTEGGDSRATFTPYEDGCREDIKHFKWCRFSDHEEIVEKDRRISGEIITGYESAHIDDGKRIKELEAVGLALWSLLDDIDTAEDMFKPKINAHFKYVHEKHRERFNYGSTDGYTVTLGSRGDE